MHAAKTLAATGFDLATRPALLVEARAAWTKALAGRPYACPVPDDVDPSIP